MNFYKTFAFSSYLMTLIGLISLTTAEGSLYLVILSSITISAAYYLVDLKKRLSIGKYSSIIFAFGGILFSIFDFLVISKSFVLSLSHLLCIIQIIKFFQKKEDRDYWQIYLISFIHLVVASALTIDVSFSIFFITYLIASIWTLTLFHLKREANGKVLGKEIINKFFFTNTAIVTLLTLIFTIAIFLVLPRIGIGYLKKSLKREKLLTGFSEETVLGDIGQILQNSDIIMRVELLHPKGPLASNLLWRGIAFDYYTGKKWKQSIYQKNLITSDTSGVIAVRGSYFNSVQQQKENLILQRVILQEMNSNVLFGLYPIRSISNLSSGLKGIYVDYTNSISTPWPHFQMILYDVASARDSESTETLSEKELKAYLQLPKNFIRIKNLAIKIIEDENDPFQKAIKVERYLKSNYGYTLNLKRTPGTEPIEDFLLFQKRGHCEYFASSMVLILRTLGIPSRYVNGFSGGEWNEFGSYYLIRQKDAHSWVEAYFPNRGWISFDPTPSSGNSLFGGSIWGSMSRYMDSLRMKWDSYLINYNFEDQKRVAFKMKRQIKNFQSTTEIILLKLRKSFSILAPFFTKKINYFLIPSVIILLLSTVSLIIIKVRKKKVFKNFLKPLKEKTKIIFYNDMLKILSDKGFKKKPETTPLEFVSLIKENKEIDSNQIFLVTEKFYKIRYGHKELLKNEEKLIRQILKKLRGLE